MNKFDKALNRVLAEGTFDVSEETLRMALLSTRRDGPEDDQARSQAREALNP